MNRDRLVEAVQQRLVPRLAAGDIAIDATVGNGHDTLFLAQQVGASGRVYGFDLQSQALQLTRARLEQHGVAARVTLCACGHERMRDHLPAAVPGQAAAVMFNLGYLHGSDKRCITQTATTLTAVTDALTLLRPGGVLSVLAYPGQSGGSEEAAAVKAWAEAQAAAGHGVELTTPASRDGRAPEWLWLVKR